MSMRNAMLEMCTNPQPKPFTPIENPNPPYGQGAQQSEDLGVASLIQKLLAGTPLDALINHIDVWGEGRLVYPGNCTGFATSFNINLNQGITFPGYTYHGYAIPNLLPVCAYDDTFDVIPDKSVKTVTTMGSPIAAVIAEEMARIVADSGVVITFGHDYNSEEISTLTSALQARGFFRTTTYQLGPGFTAVTSQPVIVFSAKSNPEPFVHDDL